MLELLIASHGIDGPKLVLHVKVCNGTVSDSGAYQSELPHLNTKIMQGNSAFSSCRNVITTYGKCYFSTNSKVGSTPMWVLHNTE